MKQPINLNQINDQCQIFTKVQSKFLSDIFRISKTELERFSCLEKKKVIKKIFCDSLQFLQLRFSFVKTVGSIGEVEKISLFLEVGEKWAE